MNQKNFFQSIKFGVFIGEAHSMVQIFMIVFYALVMFIMGPVSFKWSNILIYALTVSCIYQLLIPISIYKNHIPTCVSFGATRKSAFWSMQIVYFITILQFSLTTIITMFLLPADLKPYGLTILSIEFSTLVLMSGIGQLLLALFIRTNIKVTLIIGILFFFPSVVFILSYSILYQFTYLFEHLFIVGLFGFSLIAFCLGFLFMKKQVLKIECKF